MKVSNKRRIEKIEEKLNSKHMVRKLAMILFIKGQEDFDISSLDADIVFMRPYNGRCLLPHGLTYPEAFRDGPVISWSLL